MPLVIPTPVSIDLEGVVLDGLNLNDDVAYRLESFVVPPARKRPEWVSGGDSNGAILGREALYENRVVSCRVRVLKQATMDAAIGKIAALVDRLQEAEKGGVDLVWEPSNSTFSGTLKVLMGEVDSLPIVVEGDDTGWFVQSPVCEFTLTCLPGIRGVEVTGPTATASTPVVTVELANIPGDLPAEARLRVVDAASQNRRYFDWGLESLYYPTVSPPALLVDSDSLVTSGFSGTGNTRTGAYDPDATGNNVIRGTLATQVSAVCGTGNLGHVGTFRVKARVYAVSAAAANVNIRLSWQDSDGSMRANAYTSPAVANGWSEVDLGVVRVEPKYLGTQRWSGRVEAFSTVIGDTLDVDYIRLVPAREGHGFGRAAYTAQPGVLVGRDEFTSIASGTALNARTAPSGGSWATTGATTDLTAADGPNAGEETMSRATTADTGAGRLALLGATDYTDVEVGVTIKLPNGIPDQALDEIVHQGVIARYVGTSNYFYAYIRHYFTNVYGTPEYVLHVASVVAGTTTIIAATNVAAVTAGKLRLTVTATGGFTADLLTTAGSVVATLSGTRSALATGGVLATGKPGFFDYASISSARTRYYDDFYVSTPPAEPIVIYSGRSAEVAHNAARRVDSTGTYWGQVPAYRGAYFTVPPSGVDGRKSRVAVKAARNDVLVAADDNVTDSTTVQTFYTPVHLVVPD